MTGQAPRWWYRSRPNLLARCLGPAAAVYDRIAQRRLVQAPQYRAPMPVICVGNFTAGGTGKTPFALFLIDALKDLGATPVVLTRGYGGSLTGPERLDVACHTVQQSGDEARLLARHAPVVIARDRAAGGRFIAQNKLGTVIVMDDGLQNPGLKKDLTFAVIDARLGFGNGMVIPAGPLRASIAAQAAIADAFVFNHGALRLDHAASGSALSAALGALPSRPFVHGRLVAAAAPDPRAVGPVLAYAGIGVPERFFTSLIEYGFTVVSHRAFGDHHMFSEADAQSLLADADSRGLTLMTTEKDAARLDGLDHGPLARLRAQSLVFPVRFAFEDGDRALIGRLLNPIADGGGAGGGRSIC